jgi:hypothetical protein
MDLPEYRDALSRSAQVSEQNLIYVADWFLKSGVPWMWSELSSITGQTAKPLAPADAIRMGLETTPVERAKMPLKPSYYVAHMSMLDAEAKRVCNAAIKFGNSTDRFAPNATILDLQTMLKALLLDGLFLLEQAHGALLKRPGPYGIVKAFDDHPFQIFKGAEQFIYGRYSGLTHTDHAPYAPIAPLRTAIEIRLRSAFGIYGYLDTNNNSLRPIDLSRLFAAIQKHLPNVTFAVDFHDIARIYRWSNSYLHGGLRDAVWIPGYALQFLRPLFAGPEPPPGGGWNVNGGIRMQREVWRSIRNSFDVAAQPREKGLIALFKLIASINDAIRGVLTRRRRNMRLQLDPAHEGEARCVFSD